MRLRPRARSRRRMLRHRRRPLVRESDREHGRLTSRFASGRRTESEDKYRSSVLTHTSRRRGVRGGPERYEACAGSNRPKPEGERVRSPRAGREFEFHSFAMTSVSRASPPRDMYNHQLVGESLPGKANQA